MSVSAVSKEMKILLVDDFEVMRRILRSSLKKEGFNHFVEASGAEEALETLKKDTIDLVIADWHMPDMPGLDLLEAIRSDEQLAKIPFLMVATTEDVEHAPAALNTVKSACVAKPFSSEDLVKKIKKICKKSKKVTTSTKKAATKKTKAKKAASKKTTTKKAATKKTASEELVEEIVEEITAKKATAKKGATKKASAKKAPVKKATAKKATAKKSTTKRKSRKTSEKSTTKKAASKKKSNTKKKTTRKKKSQSDD